MAVPQTPVKWKCFESDMRVFEKGKKFTAKTPSSPRSSRSSRSLDEASGSIPNF
jgi:hypothetical protein